MKKIITAEDFAEVEGKKNIRERISHWSQRAVLLGILDEPFKDVAPSGSSVKAEVDWGRWIAKCECGGAEAVSYKEPIFFCCSCGNSDNGGKPRPVVFPKERNEIEKILLERPVSSKKGKNILEQNRNSKPTISVKLHGKRYLLARSWRPGQTIKELEDENALIGAKK